MDLKRATARRLPWRIGSNGLAWRTDRVAQARRLRRAEAGRTAANNRKRLVGVSAAICRTLPQRAREADGGSWPGSGALAGARRGSCWDQARPGYQPLVREPRIAAR